MILIYKNQQKLELEKSFLIKMAITNSPIFEKMLGEAFEALA
jgi:hypothetical protein